MDAEVSYEAPLPTQSGCASYVVVFGPPGSGKGTQAAILAEELGIPAISTGAMLREAVSAGSDLGRRVEAIMNAGALVDDATMAEVLEERLGRDDARDGFLLDGYPRTLDQAGTLDEILGRMEVGVEAVLMISVPDEELVRRMVGRGRADDTAAVAQRRLGVYREKTEPIVQIYEERGILHVIDGNRPIADVTASLLETLAECD